MDDPRVSRKERKLHLTHELHHRVHCVQTCPTIASNGSTLIIYGHDRGIRVLWRGGKRLKELVADRPDEATSQHLITIDDDGEEQAPEEPVYEESEDELDPDCPYPSMIQDMEIDLGAAVLELAIPPLPSFPYTPRILRQNTLVLVTCADGSASVLVLPLAPPSDASKTDFRPIIMSIESAARPVRRFIAAKMFGVNLDDSASVRTREDGGYVFGTLLVATATDHVHVSRLDILETALGTARDSDVGKWSLPKSATGITFHPSPRSSQLLISDRSGTARILDPYGSTNAQRRPSSRDSSSGTIISPPAYASPGKWVMAFYTPYVGVTTGLARRKQILAARWALHGRGIMVLLEDGEWGIWDVSGAVDNGKNLGQFALRGFVGSSTSSESTSSQKKGGSKLAPMTPNTRRTKAETLFTGPPKIAGVAPRGGISIATSSSRGAQLDESVLIWHNNDVYAIQSLLTFWQRSTTKDSTGFGSLHSSGIVHINDVNLMNESITSIAQLAPKSNNASFGQMNHQRDFVLSAEHRIIISQSMLSPPSARNLFQQSADIPSPRVSDLRLLADGDLDIGGMDRLLDSMANADARPRKVGFVH